MLERSNDDHMKFEISEAFAYDLKSENAVLYSLMEGLSTPVWKYMSTPFGHYSEESTQKLVDDIIYCRGVECGMWDDYFIINENGEDVSDAPEYKEEYALGVKSIQERNKIMRSLFYCILRTITAEVVTFHTYDMSYFGEREESIITPKSLSFGLLKDTLNEIDNIYHGDEVVHVCPLSGYGYSRMSHLIVLMSELYEALTDGKKLDIQKAKEGIKTKVMQEQESRGVEEVFYLSDEQKPPYYYLEEDPEKRKEWAQSFPYKEEYCRCFEEVVSYYQDYHLMQSEILTATILERELGRSITVFLRLSGDSLYADPEKFARVLAQIRRAIKTARQSSEEL